MTDPVCHTGVSSPRIASRRGYGVAAALLMLAIPAFVLPVRQQAAEVRKRIFGFPRVVVPGTAEVDLPSGPLTVFYEKRSVIAGRSFETSMAFPAMRLELRGPDGVAVPLETSPATVIYNRPPYHAHGVAEAELPAAGRYTLVAEAPPEDTADRVLALGHLPVVDLVKGGAFGVYGGAVLLAFAFVMASVIAILTWMRRHPPANRQAG